MAETTLIPTKTQDHAHSDCIVSHRCMQLAPFPFCSSQGTPLLISCLHISPRKGKVSTLCAPSLLAALPLLPLPGLPPSFPSCLLSLPSSSLPPPEIRVQRPLAVENEKGALAPLSVAKRIIQSSEEWLGTISSSTVYLDGRAGVVSIPPLLHTLHPIPLIPSLRHRTHALPSTPVRPHHPPTGRMCQSCSSDNSEDETT